MADKKKKKDTPVSLNNKKARFDYHIENSIEAGIMLTGTEVKALRAGLGSIKEAYAGPKGNELFLFNSFIPEYEQAGKHLQHEPKRPRKLLIHRRELDKFFGLVKEQGVTLVPLKLYFNARGLVKIEIGLAKGKKQHDKRDTIKQRDWDRQKARIMKDSH